MNWCHFAVTSYPNQLCLNLSLSQSQLDENSRTIRIQKNLITKYETEKQQLSTTSAGLEVASKAQSTVATQTERVRMELIGNLNGFVF